MRTYKEALKMFKFNFPSIILFEIVFKLLAAAVLVPFLYTVINMSVMLADIEYLTTSTLKAYLMAPSTYALAFIVLLVVSLYLLIDISGLIYAMEASHREEKISVIVILLKGVANALRVINPRNWGVMSYVLFILPITSSVMISGSITTVQMPDFLERFISDNDFIINILIAIYVVIAIISVFRIFSLNYFALYKVDYKEAKRLSKNTIKQNFFKMLFGLLVCNIVINAVLFLLQGALATALAGVLGKFVSAKAFRFIFEVGVQIICLVLYLIFSVTATPLIYAFICRRFYELEGDAGYEEFLEVKEKRNKRKKKVLTEEERKRKDKVAFLVFLALAILLNSIYIYLAVSNRANLSVLYSTRVSVTAHRGDSMNAPENTMAAIILADENQADVIEIDVRQTADGVLVLMHDENLSRTTGYDGRVGRVDYALLETLDAGSYFSDIYTGEPIPTLEEALEYGAQHNIFYNIELKPASTDKDYVQSVVSLIEEYDYVDDCVVSSMDYDSLVELKQINEDIKTVVILSIVVGDVSEMEYVDGFSIRHNFVTAGLVEKIHQEGKDIYVWTVNSEEKIKNLLLLDVDSIITDNPYKTKEIIYNANQNIITDWIQRLINEY